MKKRFALSMLGLLSGAVSAAQASDWTMLGSDNEGNAWLVDRASIVQDGHLMKAWKRIEFKQPKPYPPNGELISSALFLDLTNCTRREVGVKASKLLRKNGSTISAHEDVDARIEWQSVAPDTLVEKSMIFVCAKSSKVPK